MKFELSFAIQNIKGKRSRSIILILLTSFLAFSIFGGSMVIMGLQNGLKSYEARLGADVVVVPNEARSKGTLDAILLQGIPGYFYMNTGVLEKIRNIEGVETATPQFFLASASAGCCSSSVQIIGFDPETDFVIRPWIQTAYGDGIGFGDLILGNHISMPADHTMTFYNRRLNVVAQLDETGTGLDNAVYASMETIRQVMDDADSLGFHYHAGVSTNEAISSVMVRVADGCDIQSVTNDINIHVRRVEATPAKSMISSIAGGLTSVSHIVGVLTAVIWALAIAVLIVAFILIANERKKEFAILRVVGASQKQLSQLMLTESALIAGIGAASGVLLAAVVVFPFSNYIRARLNLPYLLPGLGIVLLMVLGAIGITVLAGALSSAAAARKLSHNDAAFVLREGA